MSEREPTPEIRKERWLAELTGFLAESNEHGWAAGAEKIKDSETGEKTLVYEHGDWKYVDKYTGYFAAPGETKVFHKGKHVWGMNYAGKGQTLEHYDEVKETYAFLKRALQAFPSNMPVRGPEIYRDGHGLWQYTFHIEGDITNGVWTEEIDKWTGYPGEVETYFSQTGTCGIIIDKDTDYKPVYPWND